MRGAHHNFRIAPEEESDRTAVRAPGAGVQNSGVFCARSASAGGGTRYFSQCLIFWCFWIKPKAQKKKCTTEEIDSYFGKYPVLSIRRFLQGASLPPFGTKRWCQKCPQGTSVGIGQRLSLSDHERLRLSHDRSGRSILCPICFRLRYNAEVMVCSAQP